MVLQQEVDYFEGRRAELVEHHEGKFALIHGEEFAGSFDTADNAYSEGIRRWGVTPFLIKEIQEHDEIMAIPALYLGLMLHAAV